MIPKEDIFYTKGGIFMKKLIKAAFIGILCGVLIFGIGYPIAAEKYKGIYQNTVRLHILADDDTPEAQEMKLKVRDRIIAYMTPLLKDCTDREEARRIVTEELPMLEWEAETVLQAEGDPKPVRVVFGEEYYPTRRYQNCSYPAGEYLSLRIFIGSGEGKNWWCVLYPPLCLSASSASDSDAYSEEEEGILSGRTGEYRVKFALLEWGARLKRLFD